MSIDTALCNDCFTFASSSGSPDVVRETNQPDVTGSFLEKSLLRAKAINCILTLCTSHTWPNTRVGLPAWERTQGCKRDHCPQQQRFNQVITTLLKHVYTYTCIYLYTYEYMYRSMYTYYCVHIYIHIFLYKISKSSFVPFLWENRRFVVLAWWFLTPKRQIQCLHCFAVQWAKASPALQKPNSKHCKRWKLVPLYAVGRMAH